MHQAAEGGAARDDVLVDLMDEAADEAKDDARANLLYNSLPTLSTNSSPALFRLLLVSFSTLTARVSGRRRRIVFDINDGIIAQLDQFKPLFGRSPLNFYHLVLRFSML